MREPFKSEIQTTPVGRKFDSCCIITIDRNFSCEVIFPWTAYKPFFLENQ